MGAYQRISEEIRLSVIIPVCPCSFLKERKSEDLFRSGYADAVPSASLGFIER
jgi:hypothetical protein